MSAPKPSIAATRPVNPPGASPVLTIDQLWKGLVIKAREPHRFLEIFESCEVVKEEGTLVSLPYTQIRPHGVFVNECIYIDDSLVSPRSLVVLRQGLGRSSQRTSISTNPLSCVKLRLLVPSLTIPITISPTNFLSFFSFVMAHHQCYFESGTFRVTNIVSYDSAGELQLTFSFANGIPGPNPEEALTNPVAAANKVGDAAVNHTLEAVRGLVRSGEIQ